MEPARCPALILNGAAQRVSVFPYSPRLRPGGADVAGPQPRRRASRAQAARSAVAVGRPPSTSQLYWDANPSVSSVPVARSFDFRGFTVPVTWSLAAAGELEGKT